MCDHLYMDSTAQQQRPPPGRAGCQHLPVGAKEVAEHLGVSRATVDSWRARKDRLEGGAFPAQRWPVGGRPAWCLHCDVLPWARGSGRMPG